MQILLDVPPELHKQISSSAASLGKSIADYIIEKLAEPNEELAMKELDDFLEPRIQSAKQGNFVNKTVRVIANEVLQKNLEK